MKTNFVQHFHGLVGYAPYPWQERLYDRLIDNDFPAACDLPTGLGKTSILPVWLLAFAAGKAHIPRRLVYVVNRRTVVDQTTDVAKKLRDNAYKVMEEKLAISTLRGQYADNREWSADPSRPAIICGTVDMIGSRLLFSGYGLGASRRPLHAGFLGQDVLLVHDEAHLEPSFQRLLDAVGREQRDRPSVKPFRVMALTATPNQTSSDENSTLTLGAEDNENKRVRQILEAKKGVEFHPVGAEKGAVATKIADLALGYKESGQAILVFVRTVADVEVVERRFKRAGVNFKTLTGVIRGYERDALAESDLFKRFLTGQASPAGTVYLLATAAGEVGVDISADHLVCDLTTFDSMAQRFGRVNRRGIGNAHIDIVHEPQPAEPEEGYQTARWKTFDLLREPHLTRRPDGRYDSSPAALRRVDPKEREKAFSPSPPFLNTTDILFDAWALTTTTDLPGRPPIDDWLHGVTEEGHETQFAWREDVRLLRWTEMGEDRLRERTQQVRRLLDEYPLKPHELLRQPTYQAVQNVKKLARHAPTATAWVIGRRDEPRLTTLEDLAADDYGAFVGRIVVLSPRAGGLTDTGTLDGGEEYVAGRGYDVADRQEDGEWVRARVEAIYEEDPDPSRLLPQGDDERVYDRSEFEPPYSLTVGSLIGQQRWDRAEQTYFGVRPVLEIPLEESEDGTSRALRYFVRPDKLEGDESLSRRSKLGKVHLAAHNAQVGALAAKWAEQLDLAADVRTAVRIAARCHDLGKDRLVWQSSIGNREKPPLAKSGHNRPLRGLEGYRHEFGSLIDLYADAEFQALDPDTRDLTTHLLITHHGYGRPHVPSEKAFDPARGYENPRNAAGGVGRRYATLQRRYGRWGLAYLESLVRAADIHASQHPEPQPDAVEVAVDPKVVVPPVQMPTPTITVAVDPTNPGQFFACCGLLELADRLWPGAEGWFAGGKFHVACDGKLAELLQSLVRREPDQVLTLDNGLSVKPLIAPLRLTVGDEPQQTLLLDGWATVRVEKGEPVVAANPPWNFWSGQQTSHRIWCGLREVLAAQLRTLTPEQLPDLFAQRVFQKGRFGFDPGPAWTALDVGFSPNEHGIEVKSSAAVELLAAVGLQRFRPVLHDGRDRFDYATWGGPLPPAVAAVAAAGHTVVPPATRYRGRVVARGSYAALGYSTPLTGDAHA